MRPAVRRQLDPSIRSDDTRAFDQALRVKIVGQEEGVQALVDLYQVFRAGLNSPGRPVGNLLFLGPTGSGKTHIVEAAAEILFGDARAVIKVDCAEFQHSHEIAKLIGSPPGYLGHRETHPLITQEALTACHTDKLKLTFLLFDEIEKRWPIESIRVVHRLGLVPVNEPSLWVEVIAPHRGEAFAACQWLIDQMKQVVPIWKKPQPG